MPQYAAKAARCAVGAVLVAVLWAPACKRHKATVQAESAAKGPAAPLYLSSFLHMGDPKAEPQLVSGFHEVENNAWRWTAQRFSVALRPPFGAAQKGATLDLRLTVPPPVIQKLTSVTLKASIGGTALPPETYSAAGDYDYKRDVAPSLLAGDAALIEFQLDKALAPSPADERELGIVVSRIGLASK
jgi:hypothetical protein